MKQPQFGYTLPVFATAAAVAAVNCLQNNLPPESVSINLINPPESVSIPIEQVAKISDTKALAITRSNPGENLDITKNTPIWALVEIKTITTPNDQKITILGGEGIGKQINHESRPAIYQYAYKLLEENLNLYLQSRQKIDVKIILPEGRKLAEKTSNSAFGVVEGLSLLGTSGISQPLTSQQQLSIYLEELANKAKQFNTLVFCVGENGLDLAYKQGFHQKQLIKTANWLGPMLVKAALEKVTSILLFGYHGKLIKLAGGIFHTHHHLADARLEILTAHLSILGLPTVIVQKIYSSSTTENALKLLREIDKKEGTNWVAKAYLAIANTIDQRCEDYIYKHSDKKVLIGSILFDRSRSIITYSNNSRLITNNINN